jgi:hypothetical protein
VNKEAVQRLREPAAWALVASAGLQFLAGIVMLLTSGGDEVTGAPFTVRAFSELTSGQLFTSVTVVGQLALAVWLVIQGERPSPQARTIVMIALGVIAAVALFSVIVWLSALIPHVPAMAKLAVFLFGAGKVAVTAIGGWFIWAAFQGLQPARPAPQQVPPGYGYQQGQQQYGYGQDGQPAQQGYDQGQQQAYYSQQQYPQQQGQPGQQGGYPQQQYPQQPYPQQQGEGDAGQWTQAYGSGDEQRHGDYGPAQGYGQQQYAPHEQRDDADQSWYRDDRGSQ